eukprot:350419-Chlamydomonas_euryale.AAC.3
MQRWHGVLLGATTADMRCAVGLSGHIVGIARWRCALQHVCRDAAQPLGVPHGHPGHPALPLGVLHEHPGHPALVTSLTER